MHREFSNFYYKLAQRKAGSRVGCEGHSATFRGPRLKRIHIFGLVTCEKYENASVVLLSFQSPNSSIKQFMRYISNAHDVQSILLECLPLKSVALLAEICNCDDECKCIVFCTVEEVTVMLDSWMLEILK